MQREFRNLELLILEKDLIHNFGHNYVEILQVWRCPYSTRNEKKSAPNAGATVGHAWRDMDIFACAIGWSSERAHRVKKIDGKWLKSG